MLKVCAVLAMFWFGSAAAQERIYVQIPAKYESENSARQGIRDECGLDTLLGNYVLQSVSQHFPGAIPRPETGLPVDAKVLNLTILRAHGHGGGGWSGAKSVTLKAELVQNGQVVQFMVKQVGSRGGFWGGMSGTCSIFERVAQVMGKHVVRWLVKPTSVPSDPLDAVVEEVNTEPVAEKPQA